MSPAFGDAHPEQAVYPNAKRVFDSKAEAEENNVPIQGRSFGRSVHFLQPEDMEQRSLLKETDTSGWVPTKTNRRQKTRMSTRELPRDEWIAFFDSFSRQHEGWLSTLEVLGAEVGAQIESRDQPLVGIIAELKDEDVITIFIGGKSADHLAHTIHGPTHVRLKETDEGAHEALHIESSKGPTTLLRFRSPVLPESLDGVVLNR